MSNGGWSMGNKRIHPILMVGMLLAFLVGVVLYVSWINESHVGQVQQWAEKHQYVAQNITRRYIGTPFWRAKGDDIFQADLQRDGQVRVSYFKINIWGIQQCWEDGTTDDE